MLLFVLLAAEQHKEGEDRSILPGKICNNPRIQNYVKFWSLDSALPRMILSEKHGKNVQFGGPITMPASMFLFLRNIKTSVDHSVLSGKVLHRKKAKTNK